MSDLVLFDGGDAIPYFYNHQRWIYSASSSFDSTDQGGTVSGRLESDSNYDRKSASTRNTGFGRVCRNWKAISTRVHTAAWIRFDNSNLTQGFKATEFLCFRQRRLDLTGGSEGGETHTKAFAFGIRPIPGSPFKGRFEAWEGSLSLNGVDTGNFCGTEKQFGIDPDTHNLFEVSLNVWYLMQVQVDGNYWEFWIDGKLLMSGTFYSGLIWDRITYRWQSFGSFAWSWDDAYILESANDFLPDVTSTSLYPNENGLVNWSKQNRTPIQDPLQTAYSAIDDRWNTFSTGDYIFQDGAAAEADFAMNRAFPVGQILAVQFCVLARLDPSSIYNSASPSIKLYLKRVGGGPILSQSSAFTINRRSGSWWMTYYAEGQYFLCRWLLEFSPDGPWSEDDFVDRRWLWGGSASRGAGEDPHPPD